MEYTAWAVNNPYTGDSIFVFSVYESWRERKTNPGTGTPPFPGLFIRSHELP
jgi:hypothetical protein